MLCLSFFGIGGAVAQNAVKMIPSEGQEIVFMLSDSPRVTIEENSIIIESEKEKVTCEILKGVRFEFVDSDNAGIESVEINTAIFKVTNDFIEASRLKPRENVRVVDIGGKILRNLSTDSSGYIKMDISDLPKGVFIFSSKDKKFKFYKK